MPLQIKYLTGKVYLWFSPVNSEASKFNLTGFSTEVASPGTNYRRKARYTCIYIYIYIYI